MDELTIAILAISAITVIIYKLNEKLASVWCALWLCVIVINFLEYRNVVAMVEAAKAVMG